MSKKVINDNPQTAFSWWQNQSLTELKRLTAEYFPTKEWYQLKGMNIEAIHLLETQQPTTV